MGQIKKKWWWVAFVLAIACVIGWKEKRCQSQADQCRTNYAAQAQSERLSGPISVYEHAAEDEAIATACEPNSYFCRLFGTTNLPTMLLCLIGIGGVWAALRTLKTIEVQTRHLQTAAEAARDSAEAAFLNAQAVINSERPWIEIDLGPPELEPSEEGNGDDVSLYSVQIENRGRTVAHIESCRVGSKSFGGEIKFEEMSYRSLRVFSLLGSNQRRSVGNISFWNEFSNDDWTAINDGTKSAVVRITVKYRDAIDVSKARETSVVFTWDIRNEHPERMPAFDEYK